MGEWMYKISQIMTSFKDGLGIEHLHLAYPEQIEHKQVFTLEYELRVDD